MILALMKASINKYEIAKKLGIKHQSVYAWFSGKTSPSMKHLISLSKVLGISVEETIMLLKKGK